MNERIRELAKDCDLDWHKHWNDDESNRLEKFADLIVQECITKIKITEVPVGNIPALGMVIRKIKEHFGVTE